jgi:hypothetical protein
MESGTARETYAAWLARQMTERGFTQRSLARKWNSDDPETARRSIRRYLDGMVPITRTRESLARALGAPESGPQSDSEDKEGD